MRKKIIAREVLVFFSCVIVILIGWGIIMSRNTYYDGQITKLNNGIPIDYSNGVVIDFSAAAPAPQLVEINDTNILKAPELPDHSREIEAYAVKLIYGDKLHNAAWVMVLIVFGVAYVGRFSIIAILWALKTVKSNGETERTVN